MPNVNFKFQMKNARKTTTTPVDFVVDNRESFKISPYTSINKELESGQHTFSASMPGIGNVSTQLNIKPNTRYEIEYSPSNWGRGIFSIREFVDGIYSNS